jgi:transcriptional regulator with GAF, ATPase, and Fis domain
LREAALSAFALGDQLSVRLLDQAKKIAAAESTVLIEGESGTGKDLLASLLHYLGPRPEQPLIKIDCASLPHELLESELFGYERAAWSWLDAGRWCSMRSRRSHSLCKPSCCG